MITPKNPKNEKQRIDEIESYNILDTLPEADYDGLTRIAAQICNVPIALITIVDKNRQWFKSAHGLGVTETPRDVSFCGHAINEPNETFLIEDATKDKRFHDNPLVVDNPNVIFYAGVPLKSENGLPLGTLCVIDNKPNQLTESQKKSLRALSIQVVNLLSLRKKRYQLEESVKLLEEKNLELEQFAYVAAHDIKSPLLNISNLAGMFKNDYKSKIDKEGLKLIELILNSSGQLYKFLERLMEFSTKMDTLEDKKKVVSIDDIKQKVYNYYSSDDSLELIFNSKLNEIKINDIVLDQILTNLISNAIKYNDKSIVKIKVDISQKDGYYKFEVSDNGPGIEKKYQEKIFKSFVILDKKDKYGKKGTGLGLAIVSKLVDRLGGSIRVDSKLNRGSTFTFTVLK